MKRIVLLVMLLIYGVTGHAGESSTTTLKILHLNDIHSHLLPYPYAAGQAQFGGIARAAALISTLRDDNTLVLNAGDMLVGDFMYAAAYSAETPVVGFAEFRVANMMGFDAFALGNHEFDATPAMLAAVLNHDDIKDNLPPILCANIQNPGAVPELAHIIRPDTIISRGGLNIGIIGFVTEETNSIANPAPYVIDTLWSGSLLDPPSIAPKEKYQNMINDLRARGADIVIALTHLGGLRDGLLANLYSGIDLIIGGHSHSPTHAVIPLPAAGGTTTVPYVRSGAYMRYLGKLSVTIEDGAVTGTEYEQINIFEDALLEDPFVAGAVGQFKDMVEAKWPGVYSDVVQEIPAYMDGLTDTDGYADKAETTLGNLIADAIRDTLKTNIAIEASGVIRQSLLEGDATAGDVYRTYSLGFNPLTGDVGLRLVKANVPAFNLVGALEFAVNTGGTFFFQVSGLSFEYNSSKPPGEQIDPTSIKIGGEPINFAATYTVGINEYVAGFGVALGFVSQDQLEPTDIVGYDALLEYLKNADMSNYVETQGRIVDTNPAVSVPFAEHDIPGTFSLKQNFPNPFNPSTVIPFFLNTQAHVTLEVYNILGQRVAVLIDELRNAGTHLVRFDAGNTDGKNLSSGIYYYKIAVSTNEGAIEQQVRTMVFLK